MSEKDKKLAALKDRQDKSKKQLTENAEIDNKKSISESPNQLDGYKVIDDDLIPQKKKLYPEEWKFAYRCPDSQEVANFSTINEKDQAGIIRITEDLIRKCIVIYDNEEKKQISPGEINDCHRIFFLLLLRDEYLPGNALKWDTICQSCYDSMGVALSALKLIYKDLNKKLLDSFDGRIFTFDMPNIDEPISFYIPTLDLTSKIFKSIVRAYKDKEKGNKKNNLITQDKQFSLFAPYLFETGSETMEQIKNNFKQLKQNEERFKAYLEIITKLKLDHETYIVDECEKCQSEEETELKFPGWKKFFISTEDNTGYFD